MIALGALCRILDLDFHVVEQIISEAFLKKKGKEVVRKNIQAIHLGCEQAKELISPEERHSLKRREDYDRLFLSGDEAIAFGALAGGGVDIDRIALDRRQKTFAVRHVVSLPFILFLVPRSPIVFSGQGNGCCKTASLTLVREHSTFFIFHSPLLALRRFTDCRNVRGGGAAAAADDVDAGGE